METLELWWEQPTTLEGSAQVVEITTKENHLALVLNQSLFYPEGGGQPGDQGVIIGPNGTMTVTTTRKIQGAYCHVGTIEGTIQAGDTVTMKVDGAKRVYNSRNHSAGHLVSALLEAISPGHIPVRAVHTDKAFVEFQGDITANIPDNFEALLNAEAAKNAPVTLKTVAFEEITNCPYVPKTPPKNNRPWRIMQIEGMIGIPCGGTHVKTMSEVGTIKIEKVVVKDGNTRIYYSI